MVDLADFIIALKEKNYLGALLNVVPYLDEIVSVGRRVVAGASDLINHGGDALKRYEPEVKRTEDALNKIEGGGGGVYFTKPR